MIIGDLRNIALAAVLGLVVGATGSGLFVKRYVDNAWTAKVEKQKTEAATQLQAATDRAIKAERQHNAIAKELEVQSEISKQKLDDAYRDNRALSTQLGGLRDPGRRPSGSCPSGATAGAAQQPAGETAGAPLSAEASDFLLDFARQADDAAQYANTCYNWLKRLEGLKHVE